VFDYIEKFYDNSSTSCEAPPDKGFSNSNLGMNHKNVTFAIAAIMATISAVSVGFTAPQQALAYHHHNHNNGVKVNQQIGQVNACTGAKDDGEEPGETGNLEREEVEEVSAPTVCLNTGDNQVDISH